MSQNENTWTKQLIQHLNGQIIDIATNWNVVHKGRIYGVDKTKEKWAIWLTPVKSTAANRPNSEDSIVKIPIDRIQSVHLYQTKSQKCDVTTNFFLYIQKEFERLQRKKQQQKQQQQQQQEQYPSYFPSSYYEKPSLQAQQAQQAPAMYGSNHKNNNSHASYVPSYSHSPATQSLQLQHPLQHQPQHQQQPYIAAPAATDVALPDLQEQHDLIVPTFSTSTVDFQDLDERTLEADHMQLLLDASDIDGIVHLDDDDDDDENNNHDGVFKVDRWTLDGIVELDEPVEKPAVPPVVAQPAPALVQATPSRPAPPTRPPPPPPACARSPPMPPQLQTTMASMQSMNYGPRSSYSSSSMHHALRCLDEDMDKIRRYLSAMQQQQQQVDSGSGGVYRSKIALYQAQLQRLYATKLQYQQWSQAQAQAGGGSHSSPASAVAGPDPFCGLDDVLGIEYEQPRLSMSPARMVSSDTFDTNTVNSNNPHDYDNDNNHNNENDSESDSDSFDASTSTYFGFVGGTDCCSDFKVAPHEVMIALSGYKFRGGNQVDIVEQGMQHTIVHVGDIPRPSPPPEENGGENTTPAEAENKLQHQPESGSGESKCEQEEEVATKTPMVVIDDKALLALGIEASSASASEAEDADADANTQAQADVSAQIVLEEQDPKPKKLEVNCSSAMMSYREYATCGEQQVWNTVYGSFFVRSVHKTKICVRIDELDKERTPFGICVGIVDCEKWRNAFHFADRCCYGFRSDGIQYCNGKLVGKWEEYGAGDTIVLLIYNNTIKWVVNNVIKCIQYNVMPSRKYKLAVSICGERNAVSILSACKIENAEAVMKKKKKNKKKKKKQKKKKKKKKLQELKKKLDEIEKCVPLTDGDENEEERDGKDGDDAAEDADVGEADGGEAVEDLPAEGSRTSYAGIVAPHLVHAMSTELQCIPEDTAESKEAELPQQKRSQKEEHLRRVEELRSKIRLLQKKPIPGLKKPSRVKYEFGDKIRLKNGCLGVVRFAERTYFSNNQLMFGIELCEWNPNGHSGAFEGRPFFEAAAGHGFFAKADFIASKIVDMFSMEPVNVLKQPAQSQQQQQQPMAQMMPQQQQQQQRGGGGDIAQLHVPDEHGIIRTDPQHLHAPATLDPFRFASVSTASSYFPPSRLELEAQKSDSPLTMEKIDRIVAEGTPPDFGKDENADLNINGYTLSDIHLGYRVLLSNGLAGSVRFIGKLNFDGSATWLGIELKKKHCNGHSGECLGKKYFESKEYCAYFIRLNEIERILPGKVQKKSKKKLVTNKENIPCLQKYPVVGDRVKTLNDKIGVVAYVGPVSVVKSTCIGLVLDEAWEYGNDGSVQNERYFECEKGRGYFVRLQHLIENFGSVDAAAAAAVAAVPVADEPAVFDEVDEKEKIEQVYVKLCAAMKNIERLEHRQRFGEFLVPVQYEKLYKKADILALMKEIENGAWGYDETRVAVLVSDDERKSDSEKT
eukprot:CAMPEP_0202730164 /NCGR_PEP_ID=MMETSP1385-20130828/186497_1 /ASSEMBLY_ACC=CAM_ASM_000861 /TAXON_ID=933848 /ORGANISM="Elphidium margaritaceum" /LENGTH=1465 /DNA_ID=CAMNT_0049396437 /DNA_START=68 /DNA_END=4465 /DNA_ORIENTATION=+